MFSPISDYTVDLAPGSSATTVVKAYLKWGWTVLPLVTALVRQRAAVEWTRATLRIRRVALERKNATLRNRHAALERERGA